MTNRSRREVIAWTAAGVLVLVGVATTIIGLLTPVSFWFAYQPLAAATIAPGGDAVYLSRTTAIGLAVLTLGLLALALLTGWRLAKSRTP